MTEPTTTDQPTAPTPADPAAAALAALAASPSAAVPAEAIEPFLTAAFAQVRGVGPGPGFVEAAAPLVAAAELAIAAYVNRLEDLLTRAFEADEWRWACERRSCIEAARALWPEPLGGPDAPLVSIETVDDLLEQKGRHEGGLVAAALPTGTPPSHWWWWYPAPPPPA